MSDAEREVLEELRGYADWPEELDRLVEQAAGAGRLREAYDCARAGTDADAVGSSNFERDDQRARLTSAA